MSHWRRTRMISFRVSEREFEMLRTISESEGHRSVSDFARLALCGARNGSSNQNDESLDRLRIDLEELKTTVRRVAEMLEERETATSRTQLAAVGRTTSRI